MVKWRWQEICWSRGSSLSACFLFLFHYPTVHLWFPLLLLVGPWPPIQTISLASFFLLPSSFLPCSFFHTLTSMGPSCRFPFSLSFFLLFTLHTVRVRERETETDRETEQKQSVRVLYGDVGEIIAWYGRVDWLFVGIISLTLN